MSFRRKVQSWLIRSRLRVRSDILRPMHLESRTLLLSARNARILLELFDLLDCHHVGFLNDIQFLNLMRKITDLSNKKILNFFDFLDTDFSGRIDFDEFYFLMCILIAHKDMEDKQFLLCHSATIFQLMDIDGSGFLSKAELNRWGFIFGLRKRNIGNVIQQSRVLKSKELWYEDFLYFAEETARKVNTRPQIKPR